MATYLKTSAPNNGADNTLGYAAGDDWVDTTHKQSYKCMSAATSNAIWQEYPSLGRYSIVISTAGVGTDSYANLVGDTASPGNNSVYGTNSSGTRGWYSKTCTIGVGVIGASGSTLLAATASGLTQIATVNAEGNVIFGIGGGDCVGYASLGDHNVPAAGYFYDNPDSPHYEAKLIGATYAAEFTDETRTAVIADSTHGANFTDTSSNQVSILDTTDSFIGVNVNVGSGNTAAMTQNVTFITTLCDADSALAAQDTIGSVVFLCSNIDKTGITSKVEDADYIAGAFGNDAYVAYLGSSTYAADFYDPTLNHVAICTGGHALEVNGYIYIPTLTMATEGLVPVGMDSGSCLALDPNTQSTIVDLTTTTYGLMFGLYTQPNSTWIFEFTLYIVAPTHGTILQLIGPAQTQLAAALNSSDTTFNVLDGTQLQVDDVVIVESELMLVTAISTNAITVTRGVNTTTAASHASGTAIGTIIANAFFAQGTTYDYKSNYMVDSVVFGTGVVTVRAIVTFLDMCGQVSLLYKSQTSGETSVVKAGSFGKASMARI